MSSTRRRWLYECIGAAAASQVLAAHEHAEAAAGSRTAAFETLDAGSATEIEAIAAQIIPSTEGPGAREAGVIYFIDRALATFALDEREAYRKGLAELQDKRTELFPSSTTIAALSGQQQMDLIRAVEASSFFELLRTHTVMGYLGSPNYGGNREKAGWRQIGFEDRMAWQPPFGYYDGGEKA